MARQALRSLSAPQRPSSRRNILYSIFLLLIVVLAAVVYNVSVLLTLIRDTVPTSSSKSGSGSSKKERVTFAAPFSDPASHKDADAYKLPWYRRITECVDHHRDCVVGATLDQCVTLAERVLPTCPASCHVCDNISPESMARSCFGKDQSILRNESLERFRQSEEYMFQKVLLGSSTSVGSSMPSSLYHKVRADCKNRHEQCTDWAVQGHCTLNERMMSLQCAPACFSCDQLDFKVRCPFDPAAPGVWQAGDLDRMFERIVADPTYQVTIHSSPAASTHEESDNKNNCPFQGPWVLTLDDFLTPAECDRLIALGHAQGYERSTGLGTQLYDGTFAAANMTFRTSATAWCDGNCSNDALAVSVHDKIAALTGIHIGNSENLQLLRYEEGQFYKLHNDFIPFHFDRPQGVRILTVFLYLSDVEAGGGTNFPLLNNLTVLPKRGRVVVWPSVTSERPNIVDTRTMHQALVVEKGIKYSANSWLHQKNIKIPMKTLCHQ